MGRYRAALSSRGHHAVFKFKAFRYCTCGLCGVLCGVQHPSDGFQVERD